MRVLLSVREHLYRQGLVQILGEAPGIQLSAATSPDTDVLTECRRQSPDLLVLSDAHLSRHELGRLLSRFESEIPTVRVLILAGPGQITPDEAIQSGASGHLDHDAPPELLTRAIRSIAAGEVWAPRMTLSKLIREGRSGANGPHAEVAPVLSEREIEVLRLVAQGLDNVSVAEKLHVEVSTIKTHLVRIYRKLEVGDRASAVRAADDRGLIRSRH